MLQKFGFYFDRIFIVEVGSPAFLKVLATQLISLCINASYNKLAICVAEPQMSMVEFHKVGRLFLKNATQNKPKMLLFYYKTNKINIIPSVNGKNREYLIALLPSVEIVKQSFSAL